MRRTLAALLLAVTAMTGTASAAYADKPVDIIVEDTAGVLDRNTLIPALEDIDFHAPTTVAVYTRAGAYEDNFNEEVLAYARAEHPEWISADGQKWADGLYLFALDPVGRQVGTYMGEDRKVDLNTRTKIQESTYDFLRDAQWTDGTIEGIEAGAEVINRPWYKSPAFLGAMAFLGLGCAACIGTWLFIRARNLRLARAALKTGDAAYSSVTMDLEVTELNANTIPADSTYGSKVLEKHRTFSSKYRQATELNNRVHGFSDKDLKKGANRALAQTYAALADELDGDDDLIADTNILLNLGAGWKSAWDRQTASLRGDLSGIEELVSGTAAAGATARDLLDFRRHAETALEDYALKMDAREVTPEQALDAVMRLRGDLSEKLLAHTDAVVAAHAKTGEEERIMRRAIGDSYYQPSRGSSSILDAGNPGLRYYTVGSYSRGCQRGRSDVATARQIAKNSAKSSTGYGRSGGSFSGSGSSSRF